MKIIAKALAGAATGITVASLAGAGFLPATATAATGLPGASPMLTRAPYLTDLTQTSVQVNWATTTQGTGSVGYGPAGDCSATTGDDAVPAVLVQEGHAGADVIGVTAAADGDLGAADAGLLAAHGRR